MFSGRFCKSWLERRAGAPLSRANCESKTQIEAHTLRRISKSKAEYLLGASDPRPRAFPSLTAMDKSVHAEAYVVEQRSPSYSHVRCNLENGCSAYQVYEEGLQHCQIWLFEKLGL